MSQCDKVTVIVQRTNPSMKVYIAGKITGDENYRLKFMKARQRLERDGYIVISPAVLPDRLTEADYMRICFSMIDCADAVAFLPDWKQSAGARLEHDYCAYTRKTRIFPWGRDNVDA